MYSKQRAMLIAGVLACTGSLVLFILGIVDRSKIIEGYFIWQLDSDSVSKRRIAAQNLGKLRSIRSVPKLLSALQRALRPHEGDSFSSMAVITASEACEPAPEGDTHTVFRSPAYELQRAIIEVGTPSLVTLLDAISDDANGRIVSTVCADAVYRICKNAGLLSKWRDVERDAGAFQGDPPFSAANEIIPILTKLISEQELEIKCRKSAERALAKVSGRQ